MIIKIKIIKIIQKKFITLDVLNFEARKIALTGVSFIFLRVSLDCLYFLGLLCEPIAFKASFDPFESAFDKLFPLSEGFREVEGSVEVVVLLTAAFDSGIFLGSEVAVEVTVDVVVVVTVDVTVFTDILESLSLSDFFSSGFVIAT